MSQILPALQQRRRRRDPGKVGQSKPVSMGATQLEGRPVTLPPMTATPASGVPSVTSTAATGAPRKKLTTDQRDARNRRAVIAKLYGLSKDTRTWDKATLASAKKNKLFSGGPGIRRPG